MKIKYKFVDILGLVLCLVPILLYYYLIDRFIVNIPFGDEFSAALQWIQSYVGLDSFDQRFFHLFRQANEHRIFSYHLAVLTDFSLFGEINFQRLLWAGNFLMVVLLVLVCRASKVERSNPWYVLPFVLLLFVPQHEISDWGIVAFGAILQYSLILGSLLSLNKAGIPSFILSVFLALVATFSFGNGMFVFFSGFLILLFKQKKETKYFVIWFFAMLSGISLYFINYKFSGYGYNLDFVKHPVDTLLYFFTFFGTIFNSLLFGQVKLIALFGFFVLAMLLYLGVFHWKQFRKHPVPLAVILFILLSVAAAAVSRVKFGIGGATAPRYILLQALFLCMIYIMVIELFNGRNKSLLTLILTASIILYAGRMVHNFYAMEGHRHHLQNIIFNYNVDFREIETFSPPSEVIKSLLDKSHAYGIYTSPSLQKLFPEIKKLNILFNGNHDQKVKFSFDKFRDKQKFLELRGWAFRELDNSIGQKVVVVLKSEVNIYFFSTLTVDRGDVITFFANSYRDIPLANGFHLFLDKKNIDVVPGIYRIGVGIIQSEKLIGLKFSEKYTCFN